MTQPVTNTKWPLIFFALLAAGSFFMTWVSWAGTSIPGYAMPTGDFFAVSDKKFGLANPFPQLNFTFYAFWLIPAGALAVLLLAFTGKKTMWPAALTGALVLSLATLYILFTNTLLQLGVGKSLLSSLSFGIYLTIIAGIGLILAGIPGKNWIKAGLIVVVPFLVWVSFKLVEKKVAGEKYDDTANVKSDYTLNGIDLIIEFKANDSLSNAKYREKIITVMGRVSETELPNDSTVNIKISDSTGSYVNFSFTGKYLEPAKKLKATDSVIIKGSCSGGFYSDILETETITFKRCALINK